MEQLDIEQGWVLHKEPQWGGWTANWRQWKGSSCGISSWTVRYICGFEPECECTHICTDTPRMEHVSYTTVAPIARPKLINLT